MTVYSAARLVRALALATLAALLLAPERLRLMWSGDRARWHAALGVRLALLCEACGPAAVKAAQMAASRHDLLPAPFTAALARVQDRACTPSRWAIARALVHAYGRPGLWPFQLLSWRPVAAGSVAVVLAARSPEGEQLALKLVRPGIARLIAADLEAIAFLLHLAGRHRRLAAFPLAEAFARVRPMVASQSDMHAEARASARLLAALGPFVRLPALRPKITRPTVLAMQWAVEDHRFDDPTLSQAAYETACVRLLQTLYRMIFVTGFVHCDLHPGNVACSAEGAVLIYDCGLVAELSDRDRRSLSSLFAALVDGNAERAAHAMLAAAGAQARSTDFPTFAHDVDAILARWSGKRAGAFLLAGLVGDLFDLQYRHGIRGSPGFVAAVWALATFEGLIRNRFPQLDFQKLARPFLVSGLLKSFRRAPAGYLVH